MKEDLEVLVKRANLALQPQPGFMLCTIKSYEERKLAYSFDSNENAEQYLFVLDGLAAEIDPDDDATIIHPV